MEQARPATPQKRSTLERLIYKLDDDLLLERMLDAPRGIYARLGGIGEGAGFGVGPAFQYNATRFDFKTSAAASMKKYFIGEASLRFPGPLATTNTSDRGGRTWSSMAGGATSLKRTSLDYFRRDGPAWKTVGLTRTIAYGRQR